MLPIYVKPEWKIQVTKIAEGIAYVDILEAPMTVRHQGKGEICTERLNSDWTQL